MKGKVIGVGGIFFESESPNELKDWYKKNLGFVTNDYGALFEFKKTSNNEKAYLNWSPMQKPVSYFEPSSKPFMINYRVQNLEGLLKQLKKNGTSQLGETETHSYGKFAWVLDPEGNKIELWEPIDEVFTEEHKNETIQE